jgi:hypothetical protein
MEALWQMKVLLTKKKMFEEKLDYTFVDFDGSDITGISILRGEFAGVIFHYHKVRVVEEFGVAKLQFGYTIVHPGKHDIDGLNSNEEFHTMMGDLLTFILTKKVEDEQTRTDYPEESNPQ